jgi:hypothetical protein
LKSTPRIFVEVDGMGIEGFRTAVAAVAASPVFLLSITWLIASPVLKETPFAFVGSDIIIHVAQKVFDSGRKIVPEILKSYKIVT